MKIETVREEPPDTRVSMDFYPEITDPLSKAYRKHDIMLVHGNAGSVKRLLGSYKDITPELDKSGIYAITCEEGCPFAYIGKSYRKIRVSFDEHMACWINDYKERSAVAEHLLEEGHTTDIDNMYLIEEVNNTHKIEHIEAIHIHKNRNVNLMNRNTGNVSSPLLQLVRAENGIAKCVERRRRETAEIDANES